MTYVTVDLTGSEPRVTNVPLAPFVRPLTAPRESGDPSVVEVVALLLGRRVHVVAEATGRPDTVEMTLDHLACSRIDPAYRATLVAWLSAQ